MAKKKILAVDDDAAVCDMYERGLSALGYDVVCASSGAQCRKALAKAKPDLILMDIMMSGEDGITLTRDIRADPATADIPIIIVSGLSDAATLNDALLFGAVDYLVKPLDINVLQSKLARILSGVK